MTDPDSHIEGAEYLGDGTRVPGHIRDLVPTCVLLANMSPAEAGLLASYLEVYRCEAGARLLGSGGESMLIVLEGRLETSDPDRPGGRAVVAEHGVGALLGESALIDGEPHGGGCVALEPSLVGRLRRENLARIIVEHPTLGAKILMELLGIFSARLRATRARLAALLEAQPGEDTKARR